MINDQLYHTLKLIFGDGYVELFEYCDDIIRTPTLRSSKIKEYENGVVDYKVTVDWNLLSKYLGR